MQSMAMTPAVIGSGHMLSAPPSWEAHDAHMLKETLNFGETPSRKLNDFLESTGTGPKLPSTEELNRPKPIIPDLESKSSDGSEGKDEQLINVSFS